MNLTAALASFDEVYSPRIVARMNAYDIRVAMLRASACGTCTTTPTSSSWPSTAGSMSRSAALTAARLPSRCGRATVRRAERDRPQALRARFVGAQDVAAFAITASHLWVDAPVPVTGHGQLGQNGAFSSKKTKTGICAQPTMS
jgi:hypothetical protein